MRLMVLPQFIIVVIAPIIGTAQNSITGQARVVDGDTIEIHGLSIRLRGVDAPERYQRCEDRDGATIAETPPEECGLRWNTPAASAQMAALTTRIAPRWVVCPLPSADGAGLPATTGGREFALGS